MKNNQKHLNMKTFVTLFIIGILMASNTVYSQVAVNTDGSDPDASAMLDVQSTEKGMLVPRMTESERDAISDPANGLLIFCTDDNNFYMNKGSTDIPDWQVMSSQWVNNDSKIYFDGGNVGIGNSNPGIKLQVQGKIGAAWGSTNNPSFVFGTGTEGSGFSSPASNEIAVINSGNESARFDNSGRLGLGTNNPDASAQLEIASTSRGFLPPRMSTTQREDISNPPAGLMVYDTSLNNVFFYDGSSWQSTSNRDGMSCGTVNYGGQTYNTVIIGNQCWMTENLNIGTSILGTNDQTDNDLIEKYCYDNDEDNCDDYGGLYQWNEVMQYVSTEGAQGICPAGWHIPTDNEWKILEGYVDSQYGIGDPEWDNIGWRGFDACEKLKSTNGWYMSGNGSDAYDFAALPGGHRNYNGYFYRVEKDANFWSSTEDGTDAWSRILQYNYDGVRRYPGTQDYGYSVRCLKD